MAFDPDAPTVYNWSIQSFAATGVSLEGNKLKSDVTQVTAGTTVTVYLATADYTGDTSITITFMAP